MTVTITIDAAMIAHGVSAAAGLAATVGAARLVFGGAPPSGQWARRLRRAAMAALAGLWISGGWALMQSGLGPERLNGALAVKLVAAALVTLAFPAIVHGELRLSRHDAHPVRAAAILGAVSGGALGVWGGFYALSLAGAAAHLAPTLLAAGFALAALFAAGVGAAYLGFESRNDALLARPTHDPRPRFSATSCLSSNHGSSNLVPRPPGRAFRLGLRPAGRC